MVRQSIVILLLCAILQSCTSLAQDGAIALVGKPEPDISIKMLDGPSVKLSDLKGNVVVLDFWATWCPPCQKSLPDLDRIAGDSAMAGRRLKVIAVDCREDGNTVRDYLTKNGLSLPVALDQSGSTAQDFQIRALPTTLVIRRDGIIQSGLIPVGDSISEPDLDSAITKALAD
jgi:thiol-disulfide isomerase/thioredoxin